MWTISKEFRFEAAHFLPHHDGKCASLHGHSWRGVAYVTGQALSEAGPKEGMLVDFGEIKAALNTMLDECLDHYCLNDTLPLSAPTSENVARWCFDFLRSTAPSIPWSAVRIEETCTSSATYSLGGVYD